jgi:hypothetical protein
MVAARATAILIILAGLWYVGQMAVEAARL